MFAALLKLHTKLEDFLILIVGDGSQRSFCQKTVKDTVLEEHTLFFGWKNREIAEKFIKTTDIGIIPLSNWIDMEIAIPQKVYDYMAFGVPTIVTGKDHWEISDFFKKTNAGIVIEHKSKDIADNLLKLIKNEVLLKKMSKKGKKAIIKEYNRESAALKLHIILKKILKNKISDW
jgi:glycosyltransferase involved in cell wall biosynthesis